LRRSAVFTELATAPLIRFLIFASSSMKNVAVDGVNDVDDRPVTQKSLNDDVLKMISLPGKVWWALFLLDLMVLAVALAAVRNLIVHGWGVSGFMRPVMWAVDITNFVFWVGIAHCGTLVSAVLFLFRSHFRRAVYRVAEAMTVFGVLTEGLDVLKKIARVERDSSDKPLQPVVMTKVTIFRQ